MSTHKLTESEYDKAGDFYVNWLDKNVPDRDTHIQPSTEIMLAMLGDVQGTNVCDLGCGEGYLSRILAGRGHSLQASTPPGFCCGMQGSIQISTASPIV